MGKLLFISVFILSNFLFVFGQTEEKTCPQIYLTGLPGGYLGRGEQYYLSVAIGTVGDNDWEKLEFQWELPQNIPFVKHEKSLVSFIAKEEFDGLEIKVTVKIKGLPEKCENTVSDNFKIQFNPGTPITLERYKKLSFSEEKIKLDKIVSEMKEHNVENSMALFILRYEEKETKLNLRKRILRISNYLVEKHKLPKGKFNFIFGSTGETETIIYLAPKGKGFEELNWEKRLEELFDKTTKKSK